MEISGKIPPLDRTAYNRTDVKKAEKTPAPAAKGDRVTISHQARELQAALEAVQKMDDVDHEKVARIKAQIKAGTYRVDAHKAASKMLEDALAADTD